MYNPTAEAVLLVTPAIVSRTADSGDQRLSTSQYAGGERCTVTSGTAAFNSKLCWIWLQLAFQSIVTLQVTNGLGLNQQPQANVNAAGTLPLALFASVDVFTVALISMLVEIDLLSAPVEVVRRVDVTNLQRAMVIANW